MPFLRPIYLLVLPCMAYEAAAACLFWWTETLNLLHLPQLFSTLSTSAAPWDLPPSPPSFPSHGPTHRPWTWEPGLGNNTDEKMTGTDKKLSPFKQIPMEYLLCLDVTESDPKHNNTDLQAILIFPPYSTTSIIPILEYIFSCNNPHLPCSPPWAPQQEACLLFHNLSLVCYSTHCLQPKRRLVLCQNC